jgi:uncharacterized protein (TIGR03067 family)
MKIILLGVAIMRITMVWLATVVICLDIEAAQDNASKKALDGLQGTWKMVSSQVGGKTTELSPTDQERRSWTFKGDELTLQGLVVTVKLDPSKKPAHIDLVPHKGVGSGPGIYEHDGNSLKICLAAKPGDARPKTFEAPEESTVAFFILKRDKK